MFYRVVDPEYISVHWNDATDDGLKVQSPVLDRSCTNEPDSWAFLKTPCVAGLEQSLSVTSWTIQTASTELSSVPQHCHVLRGVKASTELIKAGVRDSYDPDPASRAASVQSISTASSLLSTVSSMMSAFSARLPFRSGALRDIGGRNPRPMKLRFVNPCPLCRKELGTDMRDGRKVRKHLHAHLRQMKDFEVLESSVWKIKCSPCGVAFKYEKDLRWHLNCVQTNGTCGFCDDPMSECTGHHPPSLGNAERKQHRNFVAKLRNWEHLQFKDFQKYVDEYSHGLIRTNAPALREEADARAYNDTSTAFRRSTGSLFSVSTGSTGQAARLADQDLYNQFARQRQSPHTAESTSRRFTARACGGVEHALLQAVKDRNCRTVRLLLKFRPDGRNLYDVDTHPEYGGFQLLVYLAFENSDPNMLSALLRFDKSMASLIFLIDIIRGLERTWQAANVDQSRMESLGQCIAIFLAIVPTGENVDYLSGRLLMCCLAKQDVLNGLLNSGRLAVASNNMRLLLCASIYHGCDSILQQLLEAGVAVKSRIDSDLGSLGWDQDFEHNSSILSFAKGIGRPGPIALLMQHGAHFDIELNHQIPHDV